LASNQQADRSTIPWSQVGAGWTVALWTAATLTSQQEMTKVRPQTVYLVNPIGGRYLITTLDGNVTLQLADWSTDVRTALLTRSGAKSIEVIRLDLSSGRTQSFTAAGTVRVAKFTKPSGAAILLDRDGAVIERVSLSGAHQLTYPKSRTEEFIPSNHLLSSPDGRTLVFTSDHGLVVRAENGTLRRAIAPPKGATACSPLQWWNASSVLASCEGGDFNAGQLYVIPVITPGTITPLAPPASLENPFTVAWQLDSGVLLLNYPTDCGTGVLGELDSTGQAVTRAMPAGLGGYGLNPVGGTTSAVTFVITLSCTRDYAPALVSFNPGTNQVTQLLGGGLNGGAVLGAYGFGGPNPQLGG
jgi:TolB protein